ncbi:MAG: DUF5916 domain-containing protein, partial [Bacteroidota bacterium]
PSPFSMRHFILPILFLTLVTSQGFSQNQKKAVSAVRITGEIRIDGKLDEKEWAEAPGSTGFFESIPYTGNPARYNTEVRYLYDNSGLYIGAMMYDPHPDSIPMQLGLRDSKSLNADFFLVELSPFNDGLNAFVFQVWSSDVQSDYKLPMSTREDYSWDAVWQSKSRLNENGWVAEIKIPWSAIRFPREKISEWGINCARDIRWFRERSTWNFVNKNIDGTVNQEGNLAGIEGIKPPLRLSLSPYVSGYLQKNPGMKDWELSYNAGADLKYGINQSFTLDMTLVPDFGQVPSDDKIYNFTPYEIRYDEKRQFFTEGTELFNKGGIFYSRRIGTEPQRYETVSDNLKNNEYITSNPQQTKLLNATKVSGRTNKGLGMGLFNAISGNTWATVRDSVTGEERRILTQGTTNYNMIVFDQNLKNNSYFDLLNTNYYIPETGYCANVSGTQFKFANKGYSRAFSGNAFISQKYNRHAAPELGYHYNLTFGKIKGVFQYSFNQLLETDKYDPNDMGFNERNNKFNNWVTLSYNIFNPIGKILSLTNTFQVYYNCIYTDFKYTSLILHEESHLTTMKHLDMGVFIDVLPIDNHDYFEPRVPGHMYIKPAEYNLNYWISTDYRKSFAIDLTTTGFLAPRDESVGYGIYFEPRLRVSNKLLLIFHTGYDDLKNNIGYLFSGFDLSGKQYIQFGRRDIRTITNILQGNYMINSKMSIDLRVRHYWITADYLQYYDLRADGHLDNSEYPGQINLSFNQFNVDFTYIWNFAPGSQLSVMWKNAISNNSNTIEPHYFDNLTSTLNSPASNTVSVKLLYYLDALYFKKKSRG